MIRSRSRPVTTDRIIPGLLPGVLANTQRARYLSFFAWLLRRFAQQRRTSTNEAHSAFIKRREYELAVAALLCTRDRGARVLRAKALLCTAPIHDLQRNRGRRDWGRFDLNELALAAIDIVVDAMVETGMSVQELRRALAARAREQVECDFETASAVAAEVINALVRLYSAGIYGGRAGRPAYLLLPPPRGTRER